MAQSPYNWLEVDTQGHVTMIRFLTHAIVDERVIRILGEELFRLESLGVRTLLLDFSSVKHLSSSILAMLIRLHKKLQNDGGRLALCSIEPDIYPVFEVTHLDKLFTIFSDSNEALLQL